MKTTRHVMFLSTALAAWVAVSGVAWAAPAPVTNFGIETPARNGAVTVRPGDTIEKIAHLYRLPVSEIATLNRLHEPYQLTVGTRLLLPMPRDYVAGRFDTLYSVGRMYGVPPMSIADANHLKAPYVLRLGQVLHIPNANSHAEEAPAASTAPKKAAQITVPRPRQAMPSAVTADATSATTTDNAADGADGHVRLLKKPGPSMFSSMVNRIAGDNQAKADPFAPSPLVHPEQPAPPLAPVVAESHRAGFMWPVRGQIISSYGPKDGGLYNDGINIAAPRGTPVLAAADGVIAYVGNKLQSYGNLVLIRHGGGMITAYAHLNAVSVRAGMNVMRGQPIGSVGSTGTVAHSQLHFEVRHGTDTIDPRQYLG